MATMDKVPQWLQEYQDYWRVGELDCYEQEETESCARREEEVGVLGEW